MSTPNTGMASGVLIGVDFGGTKIEAAALDANGGFLARLRVPNPGDYDAALVAIRDLVQQLEAAAGRANRIGIGVPGSVSPRTGVMRNANTVWLNGRDFRSDITRTLNREVRVANDANCLALSEVVDGAACGATTAFALIIGTGCGGAIVTSGMLVEGGNGIAGEIGHVPLPWTSGDELPAPACWCGQRGCVEMWVSGSGFQRDYALASGVHLNGADIVHASRRGDAGAKAALDRYIDRLGRTLAMVCNVVDPDVIVLGGGMSNVAELYEQVPNKIREFVFSDAWDARVVPARWGDSSGVRGAARL